LNGVLMRNDHVDRPVHGGPSGVKLVARGRHSEYPAAEGRFGSKPYFTICRRMVVVARAVKRGLRGQEYGEVVGFRAYFIAAD